MLNKGDKLELTKAKVLNVKDDYDFYNGFPRWYRKVMLQDNKLGKVWFKTSAEFSQSIFADSYLTCECTVSGIGNGIIFVKSPKNAVIEVIT